MQNLVQIARVFSLKINTTVEHVFSKLSCIVYENYSKMLLRLLNKKIFTHLVLNYLTTNAIWIFFQIKLLYTNRLL